MGEEAQRFFTRNSWVLLPEVEKADRNCASSPFTLFSETFLSSIIEGKGVQLFGDVCPDRHLHK